MKADKRDQFKELLKLAADDKPAADFTASIMKTIEADVQREAALKTILQKEAAVGPSFSFTANVMAGMQAAKPAFVYKPIIAQKVWYGIAAAFMLILVLAGIPGPGQQASAGHSRISGIISYTYAIPPMYVIAMGVVLLLLTADYLFNRTKNKQVDNLA